MTAISALLPHVPNTRPRSKADTKAADEAFGAAFAAAVGITASPPEPRATDPATRNNEGDRFSASASQDAVTPVPNAQSTNVDAEVSASTDAATKTPAPTTIAAAITTPPMAAAIATPPTAAATDSAPAAPTATPTATPAAIPTTAAQGAVAASPAPSDFLSQLSTATPLATTGAPIAPNAAVVTVEAVVAAGSSVIAPPSKPANATRPNDPSAPVTPATPSTPAAGAVTSPAGSIPVAQSPDNALSNGSEQPDGGPRNGALGQRIAAPKTVGVGGPQAASLDAAATQTQAAPDASIVPAMVTTAAPVSQPAAVAVTTPTAAAPAPPEQLFQLVAPLRLAPDGTYTLTLQLRPADLGLVTVHVEARQGVLSVHIVADHDQARDVLRSSLGNLRSHLELGGVRAGDIDVSADRNARQQANPDGKPGTNQGQAAGQHDTGQHETPPWSPSSPDQPGRPAGSALTAGAPTTTADETARSGTPAARLNGTNLPDAPLDLRI
jgi:chemotaxis protein MotD